MYKASAFIGSKKVKVANKDRVFSPIEQIGIICQSNYRNIETKAMALQEIADKCYLLDDDYQLETVDGRWLFPQCQLDITKSIESTIDTWYYYMKDGKPLMKNPCVYTIIEWYNDRKASYEHDYLLSDFEAAYNEAKRSCDEDSDICMIIIKRKYIGLHDDIRDMYVYNRNMELVSLHINNQTMRTNRICGDVMSINVELESPFKRGDIVKINNSYKCKYGVCQSNKAHYGIAGVELVDLGIFSPYSTFGFDNTTMPVSKLSHASIKDLHDDDLPLYLIKLMYEGKADITDILHGVRSIADIKNVAINMAMSSGDL